MTQLRRVYVVIGTTSGSMTLQQKRALAKWEMGPEEGARYLMPESPLPETARVVLWAVGEWPAKALSRQIAVWVEGSDGLVIQVLRDGSLVPWWTS